MKKKYIIAIVTVVILAGVGVGSYFLKQSMNKESVATMEIYTVPSTDKVFVNGKIEPEKVENIFLDATKGTVDKVEVENGDVVEKGDTLFTYKNDQVQSQVEQLELQLNSAKSQKEEINKQNAETKKQLEDLKKAGLENQMPQGGQMPNLGQNAGGEISTGSVDEQIKLLEKQIKALKDKEYYKVTAPIGGKVILAESSTNPTQPYITVESGDYYISGSVNEKDQPKIKEGQEVQITILSTNKNINGKISSVGNTPIDNGASLAAQTGAQGGAGGNMSYYEVKITPDSQEDLTNGFHVQASVNLDKKPIEIPKEAILSVDNEEFVFKNVDGKLVKQVITYSPKEGSEDEVIVSSGLNEEDKIVSNPTPNMKEGMNVE
ncbi:efflux RND transporter periplasmic adaptor subunit [Clostridium perfringens]|mgnify:FL=1|uniref:Efflux RND transporter periplasmic adaptor subunit n=1 Tax=Clostridium perfringens TaxID=1502 RepID=A0AAE8K890_CLOPF|nr:efflux RND transporter periplasmic adaptor subunit [Clostridium perfringens]AOY54310.1 periplasmic component of efflux system [Clostridium perfringens]EJT6476263.1 efflux RND transporter periplasmic adaptor subunit [Clostridium perfringens]MBI6051013.1 efflux RND transporter periplasmic adaptor subunit [Clostridium perfringens]MBI6055837.1 efflux RND transporter periplasmic adaptor subunit [Clostridium perfringens]MBX9099773.1 efflux RND transporter periplasmic adaptor subunit [Clostridium 